MKMVSANLLTSKEFKAAKQYFDMIPLLKNIESIYNICKDEFNAHAAMEEILNKEENTLDDVEDLNNE
jgi:hypothetical protein